MQQNLEVLAALTPIAAGQVGSCIRMHCSMQKPLQQLLC